MDEVVVVDMSNTLVTCGVCNEDVVQKDWIDHIQQLHDYIAWKHGETPIVSYWH